MRIVITGAGGFVGRQVVPILLQRGAAVLLVGRDPVALQRQFPDCQTIAYEDISLAAAGYDMLVHLAVINNNQVASWEDFKRVNVDLAVHTCEQAKAAGVGSFVLVSSVHALRENNNSNYAVSKRMAAEKFSEINGIAKTVLYLPAVIGDSFSGKLKPLNNVPRRLGRILLSMLAALRPTVRVDAIADFLLSSVPAPATTSTRSLILSDGQRNNPVFRSVKRLVDVALSLTIIVLLWWVMLIVWVSIRVTSPGPGIFRQVRVGRNEKLFICLKFRTMNTTAPNAGTHEVSAAEVTTFGKVLRRTKLDELPQVFNVLKNEMSFVGPRPCLPSQLILIEARRALGIFHATPGITGFAQIQGLDMSDPAALSASDQEYLRLQSLVLDAKIIAKTALGGGSGDNVRS